MRFFLIGGLIWKFGAPIKVLIDKYFNTLATLFTILLIGITALVLGVLGDDEEKPTKSVEPTTGEELMERDTTASDIDTLITIEPCDTLDL
jgi:F0F1-type ATP synthase assembly protein I